MSENELQLQKQLATRIAANASASEKEAIGEWIDRLLVVRASQLSSLQKAKLAISVTSDSEVVLPTVKIIGREAKRLAWDDRSVKARIGFGGTAIALAVFGGQSAGIAALGTAVGVPLWVVFGAGATFVGVLYEEITGRKVDPKTTYAVIDAERKDQG
jgi:hypothetical protein